MRSILNALMVLALATPAFAADKKIEDAVAKAESQIAKGQVEQAEKNMQKLAQQMGTADAYAALARVEIRAGNMDAAAAAADQAGKLAASATPEVKGDVYSTLALLDLQRGSGKDAVAHAQEAVTAAPSPATLATLANAQARVGDAAAVATAQKAIEGAGATSAAAHESLGRAFLAMQRNDESAAAFRKALEIEAKRGSARAGLAAALIASGKAAEAVTEARKASEDDPKSAEAFAVLGTAIFAADNKAWNDAIAQAQQGAFLAPRNPVVQTAVGQLFEAAGNYDQAALKYQSALQADPGYAPAQLAQLAVQSRKGNTDAALTTARALATAQPQNAQVQLALGRLLARKNEWDDALEPLQKAAAALPSNAEAQAMLGTAYQFSGQSDDALAAYKKAMALAPNNNDYRTTYGLLLGLNKQYAEGIAELQKVTGTAGYKDAAGWINLGWLYRNVDPPKADESAAAYTKALGIDPKNAQAELGLGWAYLTGQKYDQAIEHFNKAIALEPKTTTGEAQNGIGWSHFFKKEIPQAKAAAEKAKAAGRNPGQLLTNIDRAEKGQQADEAQARAAFRQEQAEVQGPDVGTLGNQLMKGGAAAKRSAAAQLGRLGKPAVQYLNYCVANSQELIPVRQSCAAALGNVGGAAREACGQLQAIATRGNPYNSTIAEKENMEKEAQYEDLRRAARAAVGRIGC
jgi:tetratricopeptide (TPR) repeat protein